MRIIILLLSSMLLASCIEDNDNKSLMIINDFTFTKTLYTPLVVTEDNIVVDFKGHCINGQRSIGQRPLSVGLTIRANNVTVKNGCITNTETSINITGLFDYSAKKKAREMYAQGTSSDDINEFMAKSTIARHSIIDNMYLTPKTHAVYVQPYVGDVIIMNSVIRGGRIGLYLDSGTHNLRVINNTFNDVGHRKYFPKINISVPVIKGRGRESIACDGCYDSIIESNKFTNSHLADITMYTNCWEHYGNDRSYPRTFFQNSVRVYNNNFNSRKGVWIASRQERDLSAWGCGSPDTVSRGRYFDHATNNNIVGNTFASKIPVQIADDFNHLSNNTFTNGLPIITVKADGSMPRTSND